MISGFCTLFLFCSCFLLPQSGLCIRPPEFKWSLQNDNLILSSYFNHENYVIEGEVHGLPNSFSQSGHFTTDSEPAYFNFGSLTMHLNKNRSYSLHLRHPDWENTIIIPTSWNNENVVLRNISIGVSRIKGNQYFTFNGVCDEETKMFQLYCYSIDESMKKLNMKFVSIMNGQGKEFDRNAILLNWFCSCKSGNLWSNYKIATAQHSIPDFRNLLSCNKCQNLDISFTYDLQVSAYHIVLKRNGQCIGFHVEILNLTNTHEIKRNTLTFVKKLCNNYPVLSSLLQTKSIKYMTTLALRISTNFKISNIFELYIAPDKIYEPAVYKIKQELLQLSEGYLQQDLSGPYLNINSRGFRLSDKMFVQMLNELDFKNSSLLNPNYGLDSSSPFKLRYSKNLQTINISITSPELKNVSKIKIFLKYEEKMNGKFLEFNFQENIDKSKEYSKTLVVNGLRMILRYDLSLYDSEDNLIDYFICDLQINKLQLNDFENDDSDKKKCVVQIVETLMDNKGLETSPDLNQFREKSLSFSSNFNPPNATNTSTSCFNLSDTNNIMLNFSDTRYIKFIDIEANIFLPFFNFKIKAYLNGESETIYEQENFLLQAKQKISIEAYAELLRIESDFVFSTEQPGPQICKVEVFGREESVDFCVLERRIGLEMKRIAYNGPPNLVGAKKRLAWCSFKYFNFEAFIDKILVQNNETEVRYKFYPNDINSKRFVYDEYNVNRTRTNANDNVYFDFVYSKNSTTVEECFTGTISVAGVTSVDDDVLGPFKLRTRERCLRCVFTPREITSVMNLKNSESLTLKYQSTNPYCGFNHELEILGPLGNKKIIPANINSNPRLKIFQNPKASAEMSDIKKNQLRINLIDSKNKGIKDGKLYSLLPFGEVISLLLKLTNTSVEIDFGYRLPIGNLTGIKFHCSSGTKTAVTVSIPIQDKEINIGKATFPDGNYDTTNFHCDSEITLGDFTLHKTIKGAECKQNVKFEVKSIEFKVPDCIISISILEDFFCEYHVAMKLDDDDDLTTFDTKINQENGRNYEFKNRGKCLDYYKIALCAVYDVFCKHHMERTKKYSYKYHSAEVKISEASISNDEKIRIKYLFTEESTDKMATVSNVVYSATVWSDEKNKVKNNSTTNEIDVPFNFLSIKQKGGLNVKFFVEVYIEGFKIKTSERYACYLTVSSHMLEFNGSSTLKYIKPKNDKCLADIELRYSTFSQILLPEKEITLEDHVYTIYDMNKEIVNSNKLFMLTKNAPPIISKTNRAISKSDDEFSFDVTWDYPGSKDKIDFFYFVVNSYNCYCEIQLIENKTSNGPPKSIEGKEKCKSDIATCGVKEGVYNASFPVSKCEVVVFEIHSLNADLKFSGAVFKHYFDLKTPTPVMYFDTELNIYLLRWNEDKTICLKEYEVFIEEYDPSGVIRNYTIKTKSNLLDVSPKYLGMNVRAKIKAVTLDNQFGLEADWSPLVECQLYCNPLSKRYIQEVEIRSSEGCMSHSVDIKDQSTEERSPNILEYQFFVGATDSVVVYSTNFNYWVDPFLYPPLRTVVRVRKHVSIYSTYSFALSWSKWMRLSYPCDGLHVEIQNVKIIPVNKADKKFRITFDHSPYFKGNYKINFYKRGNDTKLSTQEYEVTNADYNLDNEFELFTNNAQGSGYVTPKYFCNYKNYQTSLKYSLDKGIEWNPIKSSCISHYKLDITFSKNNNASSTIIISSKETNYNLTCENQNCAVKIKPLVHIEGGTDDYFEGIWSKIFTINNSNSIDVTRKKK